MPSINADMAARLSGRYNTTVVSDGVATVTDSALSSYQVESLMRDVKAFNHYLAIVAGALTIQNTP